MLEYQSASTFYLFNFDQPKTNQAHFFQPDFWRGENRLSGSAQGRGTTYFVQSEDWFGVNCALRHYYRGGLIGKFNKDLFLFKNLAKTRSFAEFRLLARLQQAGLPVPKPIGARVQKVGIFYRADLLSQRIENARDLTDLLQREQLTPAQWQQIGALIRRLHDLQICHSDLNAHNILCQQKGNETQFWLIDFDKCGERAGEDWKAENLQRLHRSFIKEIGRMAIQFSPQNWADLLSGYQDKK